jgi:hypothetical protein
MSDLQQRMAADLRDMQIISLPPRRYPENSPRVPQGASPGPRADLTEASGGIWERLHYEWSDPNHVLLTTTDANSWGGASGHTYTFTRRPDGLTDIDVVVVRDGKNLKGRLLGFVLGTIGKRVLEKALKTPSRLSKPGTA